MSNYPQAIDQFVVQVNDEYDSQGNLTAQGTIIDANDYNAHSRAIVSIESVLGVNPNGGSTNVAARLSNIEEEISSIGEAISDIEEELESYSGGWEPPGSIIAAINASNEETTISVSKVSNYTVSDSAKLKGAVEKLFSHDVNDTNFVTTINPTNLYPKVADVLAIDKGASNPLYIPRVQTDRITASSEAAGLLSTDLINIINAQVGEARILKGAIGVLDVNNLGAGCVHAAQLATGIITSDKLTIGLARGYEQWIFTYRVINNTNVTLSRQLLLGKVCTGTSVISADTTSLPLHQYITRVGGYIPNHIGMVTTYMVTSASTTFGWSLTLPGQGYLYINGVATSETPSNTINATVNLNQGINLVQILYLGLETNATEFLLSTTPRITAKENVLDPEDENNTVQYYSIDNLEYIDCYVNESVSIEGDTINVGDNISLSSTEGISIFGGYGVKVHNSGHIWIEDGALDIVERIDDLYISRISIGNIGLDAASTDDTGMVLTTSSNKTVRLDKDGITSPGFRIGTDGYTYLDKAYANNITVNGLVTIGNILISGGSTNLLSDNITDTYQTINITPYIYYTFSCTSVSMPMAYNIVYIQFLDNNDTNITSTVRVDKIEAPNSTRLYDATAEAITMRSSKAPQFSFKGVNASKISIKIVCYDNQSPPEAISNAYAENSMLAPYAMPHEYITYGAQQPSYIMSADYQPNYTGWYISESGNAEFNNAKIRGALYSSIFIKEQIQATDGTLYVRPAGILYETTSLNISQTGAEIKIRKHYTTEVIAFSVDDYLQIKAANRDGTGYVTALLQVTSVGEATPDYAPFTVDVIEIIGDNMIALETGNVVLNVGQPGEGGIVISSDVSRGNRNVPAIEIYSFDSIDESNTIQYTVKTRIGNLTGIVGSPDTFGRDFPFTGYGLYAENAYLSGTVALPNAGITGIGNSPNSVRMWAGASLPEVLSDPTLAPFRVLQDGTLYATNGHFEGKFYVNRKVDSTYENVLTINEDGITMAYGKLQLDLDTTDSVPPYFFISGQDAITEDLRITYPAGASRPLFPIDLTLEYRVTYNEEELTEGEDYEIQDQQWVYVLDPDPEGSYKITYHPKDKNDRIILKSLHVFNEEQLDDDFISAESVHIEGTRLIGRRDIYDEVLTRLTPADIGTADSTKLNVERARIRERMVRQNYAGNIIDLRHSYTVNGKTYEDGIGILLEPGFGDLAIGVHTGDIPGTPSIVTELPWWLDELVHVHIYGDLSVNEITGTSINADNITVQDIHALTIGSEYPVTSITAQEINTDTQVSVNETVTNLSADHASINQASITTLFLGNASIYEHTVSGINVLTIFEI